jgi:hypothetical protein
MDEKLLWATFSPQGESDKMVTPTMFPWGKGEQLLRENHCNFFHPLMTHVLTMKCIKHVSMPLMILKLILG